jgi:hypothetical protein
MVHKTLRLPKPHFVQRRELYVRTGHRITPVARWDELPSVQCQGSVLLTVAISILVPPGDPLG